MRQAAAFTGDTEYLLRVVTGSVCGKDTPLLAPLALNTDSLMQARHLARKVVLLPTSARPRTRHIATRSAVQKRRLAGLPALSPRRTHAACEGRRLPDRVVANAASAGAMRAPQFDLPEIVRFAAR